MPDTIGKFVEGSPEDTKPIDGNARVNADTNPTDRTESRTGEPEILYGYDTADPATERIGGNGGSERRTKSGKIDGRTLRGKRNAETGAKESIPLTKLDIAELLYSIHLMGAEICKLPELELDKAEADKLGDAIKNVGQYYGAVLDPKKVAIFHLCVIAGGIYGTRFFAIRNRLKIEAERNPAQQKSRTVPINSGGQKTPRSADGGQIPVEMLWGNNEASL